MTLIALGLIAILLSLAALHLYWGFGGFWPGSDPASLTARVAGWNARKAPGFLACAAVALALASAAAVVFFGQGRIASGLPAWLIYPGYAVLILVFGGRGLAPYLTPIFNYAKGTPFYELNRRYYAPLCLIVAAGLIANYPQGLDVLFR